MLASEAGEFRSEKKFILTKSKVKILAFLAFYAGSDLNDDCRKKLIAYCKLRKGFGNSILNELKTTKDFLIAGVKEDEIELSEVQNFEESLNKAYTQCVSYLAELKKDSELGHAYPYLSLSSETIDFVYKVATGDKVNFDVIIQCVFDRFNRSISEVDEWILHYGPSEKLLCQKLMLIADLYQKLEWFHPFPDGQGRTDVILLGMLLAKHGFCPTILDHLYASSYVPLDVWAEYLIEGMVRWREEAAKQCSMSHAPLIAQQSI